MGNKVFPGRMIWKFPMPSDDVTILEMPEGSEILTVQFQREVPCLWAVVDPQRPIEKRRFHVYATGMPLGSIDRGGEWRTVKGVSFPRIPWVYIGTYQEHGRSLHLFEVDGGAE